MIVYCRFDRRVTHEFVFLIGSSFIKHQLFRLFIILILSGFSHARAQSIVVDRQILSVEAGLSDRLLNDMARDTMGFYWFGGRGGLSRFDGTSFLNINDASSPEKLSHNEVVTLRRTQGGYLTTYLQRTYGTMVDILDVKSGEISHIRSDSTTGVPGILLNKDFDQDGRSIALSYHQGALVVSKLDYHALNYVEQIRYDTDLISDYNSRYPPSTRIYECGEFFLVWILADDLTSTMLLIPADADAGPVIEFAFGNSGTHDFFALERENGEMIFNSSDGFIYRLENKSKTPERILKSIPYGNHRFLEDTLGNLLIYPPDQPGNKDKRMWMLSREGELSDYSEVASGVERLFGVYSDNLEANVHLVTGRGYEIITLRGRHVRCIEHASDHKSYGISGRGIIRLNHQDVLLTTDFKGFKILNTDDWTTSIPSSNPGIEAYMDKGWFGRNVYRDQNDMVWGKFDSHALFAIDLITGTMDSFHTQNYVGVPVPGLSSELFLIGRNMISQFDKSTGSDVQLFDHRGINPLDTILGTNGIVTDSNILWISTTEGLLKYDLHSKRTTIFKYNSDGPIERLCALMQTEDGLLWVGSVGQGLLKFDLKTEAFVGRYSEADGLCDDRVAGILTDDAGNLWISTYDGISCFNPVEETFINYYVEDGFSHNEFNRYSYYYDDQSGLMFFGGMNGFNVFNPEELLNHLHVNTTMRFAEINWVDADTKVQTVAHFNGANSCTISLPPNNRRLVVRYGFVDNINSSYDKYFYRIKELNDNWIALGSETTLRLDYLPVGDFTCEIKGIGKRGIWTSEPLILNIRVLQYWYFRWWALGMYAIVFLAMGIVLYRFAIKRKLELQNSQKLAELNQFKDDFFTNVTHEFRTPLTIILGSSDIVQAKLEERDDDPEKADLEKHIGRIHASGQNLLRLINQILDLTRNKEAKWDLEYVSGDIIRFCGEICDSFEGLAETKSIALKCHSAFDELIMDYDPRQLRLILHNLLSNAIKFTPEGGRVDLTMKSVEAMETLVISVADTGIGMSADDQARVFEKYYRVENNTDEHGTGIGLSLVRELVLKMEGEISLKSAPGEGSVFALSMPIRKTGTAMIESTPATVTTAIIDGERESGIHELLIIEDNPDISAFLRECLEEEYSVSVTHNGETGVQLALEQMPDIILSDVMMPVMDGFEVCNRLKTNPLTDHIPIVFLSAKSEVEDRIEGIQKGADAYLAKPFNVRELKAVLSNLLVQRQKMRDHFQSLIEGGQASDSSSNQDEDPNEAMILRLRDYVIRHLADADLSGESLAQSESMSYWALNRKLAAMAGLTPVKFMTSIRLESAAELLVDPSLNISEIAYQVGFNDPKYFSRLFTQHFGHSPRQARQDSKRRPNSQ